MERDFSGRESNGKDFQWEEIFKNTVGDRFTERFTYRFTDRCADRLAYRFTKGI